MKRVLVCLLCVLSFMLALPTGAFAYEPMLDYDALDTPYEDYQKFRDQNITLNVYNWGEYISDGSDDAMDVNKEFEALTGIKVNYLMFASNEELFAKMKSGGSSYDIVIPSDYMIARLVDNDLLLELNYDNIPNIANMDESYLHLEFDPEQKYSAPYTWGEVVLVYNTTLVDPDDDLETWEALWNEKYMGNMLMFSNSRDAFGIALKVLGYSQNTTDPDELEAAAQKLEEQKLLVQAYVMDEIFDKMGGGEAALAPYYAGDAIVMMDENPDLAASIPREGTNLFVDAICVPKSSRNQEAAEMYVNFLCETQVAMANFEYIGYATPLRTVREQLSEEEIAANPIQFPSQEKLDTMEVYTNLPDETNALMDSLWTRVLSAETGENKWFIPIFIVASLALTIGIDVVRRRKRRRDAA